MKVNDLTEEKKETCRHSVHGNSFSQDEIFKEKGEDTDSPLLAESFRASAVKNSYTVFSQLSWCLSLPPAHRAYQFIKKKKEKAPCIKLRLMKPLKKTFVNLNEG